MPLSIRFWALRLADLLIKVGENQRATETLRSLELHAEPSFKRVNLPCSSGLADRSLWTICFPPLSLIDRVSAAGRGQASSGIDRVSRLAIATQDPRLIEDSQAGTNRAKSIL